jgi:hypothetical protein
MVVRRRTAGPVLLIATVLLLLVFSSVLSGCAGAGASPSTAVEETQAPISIYADSPSPSASPGSTAPSDDPNEVEDLKKVELLGVALGADGAYVTVQFKAPPRLARSWQAGEVSVTDESTQTVYDDIPVVPVLGALFGKPVVDGQIGYVMFANLPPLAVGAQVTVVLGGFSQEHVNVQ